MPSKSLLIPLTLLSLLTGCADPRQQPQYMAAYCSRLGFPPGDPHYWDCIDRQMEANGRANAAARRNQNAAALGAATYLLSR